MSYCRWSTPNCDLYCYEHIDGYYSTNVAGYRERAWKTFYHWLTDRRLSYIRVPRWGYLFWLPHWMRYKRIGLPFDGESFSDDDIWGFYGRIKWLRDIGYRVPDYLLPQIEAELDAMEER